MRISDFDYHLPPQLIAQYPSERRDQARLMVVHRESQEIQHARVTDLPKLLTPDDLLVLNDTRVIPARLYASRQGLREKIEVLLLKQLEGRVWEVLVRPGKKARAGVHLIFEAGQLEATVVGSSSSGARLLQFEYRGDFWNWLNKLGRTPLPPYIDREPIPEDRERYQTVFARIAGSVAAPTAGLHFTPELLEKLPHCQVTLHVGYGTFKPLSGELVEHHQMESEFYEVSPEAANSIAHRLGGKGRVVAVGTTSTRVLEYVLSIHGQMVADRGWADLFIYPGFDFQATQGLITNFHLPRSTLLLLVCAFAGKELIAQCYREAIEKGYRFYSYGDAMLIV